MIEREDLLRRLREMNNWRRDPETDHITADKLLLDYINDEEIRAAYEAMTRWYA